MSDGTPFLWNIFTTKYPSIEVCSEGLIVTLLPDIRAALICPINIATGKFHGLMHIKCPFGEYDNVFSSPVGPSSS